jgi:single-strand DNA-binding protein
MSSFNKVILMGNLTRDIELRYTPSGTAVADIGMAVNEKRKDATGNLVEETTFVEVTLWGRTAEVAAEYLEKGSPVLIEGRLKLDSWENEAGEKRSKMKVVCNQMQMVGGKNSKNGSPAKASKATVPASNTIVDAEPPVESGEDIPF